MNPQTGTFISMDSYQGSIYDPVSLHKYLYANANPVMYCDPSGYSSVENELEFYKDVWLTIDQAVEYIDQLADASANEVAYNAEAVRIGREIIHQLLMTGMEYAITSALTSYVGPELAREIANGIMQSLDIALSLRNQTIDDKLGIADNKGASGAGKTLNADELKKIGTLGDNSGIRHVKGTEIDARNLFDNQVIKSTVKEVQSGVFVG